MRYLHVPALIAGVILGVAGCGPVGPTPMPLRLDDNHQKQFNDGWEKALKTPDKLDRKALLDALIFTQAYSIGVDRLTFRSEKDLFDGKVIMEIQFDRIKPAEDRFEVRVQDRNGKEMNHLVYTRAEVETTFAELHDPKNSPDRDPHQEPLAPVEAAKREEVLARIEAIKKLFPDAGNAQK